MSDLAAAQPARPSILGHEPPAIGRIRVIEKPPAIGGIESAVGGSGHCIERWSGPTKTATWDPSAFATSHITCGQMALSLNEGVTLRYRVAIPSGVQDAQLRTYSSGGREKVLELIPGREMAIEFDPERIGDSSHVRSGRYQKEFAITHLIVGHGLSRESRISLVIEMVAPARESTQLGTQTPMS